MPETTSVSKTRWHNLLTLALVAGAMGCGDEATDGALLPEGTLMTPAAELHNQPSCTEIACISPDRQVSLEEQTFCTWDCVEVDGYTAEVELEWVLAAREGESTACWAFRRSKVERKPGCTPTEIP